MHAASPWRLFRVCRTRPCYLCGSVAVAAMHAALPWRLFRVCRTRPCYLGDQSALCSWSRPCRIWSGYLCARVAVVASGTPILCGLYTLLLHLVCLTVAKPRAATFLICLDVAVPRIYGLPLICRIYWLITQYYCNRTLVRHLLWLYLCTKNFRPANSKLLATSL